MIRTVHAEEDCMNNFLSKEINIITSRTCILVIRVHHSTGELLMSKPCKNCSDKIKNIGIKHVYYSNENGTITYEKY